MLRSQPCLMVYSWVWTWKPDLLHTTKGSSKVCEHSATFTPHDSQGYPLHVERTCCLCFEELKEKLTTSPVLAYPFFDRDFIPETDASLSGLVQSLHKSSLTAESIQLLMPVDHCPLSEKLWCDGAGNPGSSLGHVLFSLLFVWTQCDSLHWPYSRPSSAGCTESNRETCSSGWESMGSEWTKFRLSA